MTVSLKELIVVLAIAVIVFRLLKPAITIFCREQDFSRRRNAWILLTIAAFLSPNFWVYAAFAVPVVIWTGRKDPNPGALYLLLFQVIPTISVTIPMVGLSRLFNLDNYLLLSIFLLAPAAYRIIHSKGRIGTSRFTLVDAMILSYGALSAFHYLRPELSPGVLSPFTFTDGLRRAFVFVIGLYVPYFVFSRTVSDRAVLVENLATYCLACAIMAATALFETSRHWLLYGELAARWGHAATYSDYYVREGSIRAMASAGHPLALGFLLEIAIGFWLCLQPPSMPKRYRLGVLALLVLGLVVTYSRGPWLAALCIVLVFYALRPRPFSRLMKLAAAAAVCVGFVSLLPTGERILDMLPLIGASTHDASLTYRQRLLDDAWPIIQQYPFLGDPTALLGLQNLRQGERIIDIINSYIDVLLSDGFLGLTLFLGIVMIGLRRSYRVCRRTIVSAPRLSVIGSSLIACTVGTFVLMWDGSFGGGLEQMYYALAAFMIGYSYIGRLSGEQDLQAPSERPPFQHNRERSDVRPTKPLFNDKK